MKKVLIVAVLCIALAMIGVAGCVGGDPIVGNWQTKPVLGVYLSVEFVNGGTGSITVHTDLTPAEGTGSFNWEKTADKTYKITSSDKTFSAGTYTLSDDGKTLTGPLGVTLTKA